MHLRRYDVVTLIRFMFLRGATVKLDRYIPTTCSQKNTHPLDAMYVC